MVAPVTYGPRVFTRAARAETGRSASLRGRSTAAVCRRVCGSGRERSAQPLRSGLPSRCAAPRQRRAGATVRPGSGPLFARTDRPGPRRIGASSGPRKSQRKAGPCPARVMFEEKTRLPDRGFASRPWACFNGIPWLLPPQVSAQSKEAETKSSPLPSVASVACLPRSTRADCCGAPVARRVAPLPPAVCDPTWPGTRSTWRHVASTSGSAALADHGRDPEVTPLGADRG
jgi:hypothetical protein